MDGDAEEGRHRLPPQEHQLRPVRHQGVVQGLSSGGSVSKSASIHILATVKYTFYSRHQIKNRACPPLMPSVTFVVNPDDSETGLTGELWSKTNLIK